MLFSSYTFVLLFLPFVVAVHYYLSKYWRQEIALGWLLLASLFFYGWWKPVYLLLLLASIGVNYVLGSKLMLRSQQGRPCRMLLVTGIVFNLGLLAWFKYGNFFLQTAAAVTGVEASQFNIVLPLAISFFTFQQCAFLVDASQGRVKRVDPLRYAVFVSFFPQLIAGPIVHHSEMFPQLERRERATNAGQMSLGLGRFSMGLFKKVLLADQLGHFVGLVFDQPAEVTFTALDYSLGLLAFSLQIYFDFSAYSDMAVGLGKMFGISLPENFDSPYKVSNIIDFWRRWHMTLSRFLKNYLYIPLGGNRKGVTRRYLNLMLTMMLGGLWHGAGWQFIFWGFLHGLYLSLNHLWRGLGLSFGTPRTRKVLAMLCTFSAVTLAWLFFRANSLDQAFAILGVITSLENLSYSTNFLLIMTTSSWQPLFGWLGPHWLVLVLLGLLAWVMVLPNAQELMAREYKATPWYLLRAGSATVSIILFISLLGLSVSDAFIYFQF